MKKTNFVGCERSRPDVWLDETSWCEKLLKFFWALFLPINAISGVIVVSGVELNSVNGVELKYIRLRYIMKIEVQIKLILFASKFRSFSN